MVIDIGTAARSQDALAEFFVVVGQSIALDDRIEQALALQRIQAAHSQNVYIQSVYQQLLSEGVRIYAGMTGADIARKAAALAGNEVANVVDVVGQNYGRLVRSRRPAFREANARVGREANRAALQAFERGRLGTSTYRSGETSLRYKRYAGGKMAAALSSDEMFLAKPDGLLWLNGPHLDIQAPQWYRLNFGAGAKGASSKRPVNYSLKFFDQNVGTIGLVGFQVSPSFFLPAGFFTSDGSFAGRTANGAARGQAFRPVNFQRGRLQAEAAAALQTAPVRVRAAVTNVNRLANRRQLSQGIRGTGFLDAGIAAMAQGWPIAQTRLIGEIMRDSIQSKGTITPFSVAGIDLADQRVFAKQLTTQLDSLVSRSFNTGIDASRL